MRLGYIYSAYNTGSRIFLAFSVRVQSLYNGGLRLTLEHAKWLIANNFFKRGFNFEQIEPNFLLFAKLESLVSEVLV